MKKIFSLLLSAILIILCLPSCEKAEEQGYFTRTLRDERGRLSVSLSRDSKEGSPLSDEELKKIYNETCETFAKAYDFLDNKEKSDISAINAPVKSVFDIDKNLISEIEKAIEISALTDRLYEPCGGALTKVIAKTGSPSDPEIDEALLHIGSDKFVFSENSIEKSDPEAMIDLYCYRDGYALKAACEYLKESICAYGTVTFNGIAGVFGEKPNGELFSVEIGNGADGTFNISDGYVALVNEDFGMAYDYADGKLDPGLTRATVYAADAETAAILASVGYVHGSGALLSLYEKEGLVFEAVLTEKDGTETFTKKAESTSLYTPITTADSQ